MPDKFRDRVASAANRLFSTAPIRDPLVGDSLAEFLPLLVEPPARRILVDIGGLPVASRDPVVLAACVAELATRFGKDISPAIDNYAVYMSIASSDAWEAEWIDRLVPHRINLVASTEHRVDLGGRGACSTFYPVAENTNPNHPVLPPWRTTSSPGSATWVQRVAASATSDAWIGFSVLEAAMRRRMYRDRPEWMTGSDDGTLLSVQLAEARITAQLLCGLLATSSAAKAIMRSKGQVHDVVQLPPYVNALHDTMTEAFGSPKSDVEMIDRLRHASLATVGYCVPSSLIPKAFGWVCKTASSDIVN